MGSSVAGLIRSDNCLMPWIPNDQHLQYEAILQDQVYTVDDKKSHEHCGTFQV